MWLMGFAINSVVRGYETVMPNSHMIQYFIVGIYFCKKAVTRNIFLKRKVSSKYPKIKPSKITRYTVLDTTGRVIKN